MHIITLQPLLLDSIGPEKNRDLLRNFPKEKRGKKRKKTGRILSSSVSPLHGCWGGFLSWRDRVSPLGGSVEKGGKRKKGKRKIVASSYLLSKQRVQLGVDYGDARKERRKERLRLLKSRQGMCVLDHAPVSLNLLETKFEIPSFRDQPIVNSKKRGREK